MKAKYAVIAVVVIIVFAVAGYWLGTRSPVKTGPGAVAQSGPVAVGDYPPAAGAHVDFNEVLGELKKRLSENPNDWELNSKIGNVYFDMRRFDEAVVYYKKALALNPKDVNTYNDLAISNHYLLNPAEGLKYAEEGIKVDPYYQRIWLTKGFILYYGLGKKDAAVAAWKKAEALDPSSPVGKDAKAFVEEFKKR